MVDVLPRIVARQRRNERTKRVPLQSQRRIDSVELTELLDAYVRGDSVAGLVQRHRLSRTTVLAHLKRAGIEARVSKRKLTDQQVEAVGYRYQNGESLAVLAKRFEVDASTIRRELSKAGVVIRPRPGWSSANRASTV